MSPARPLTRTERRLVEEVRREVATLGLSTDETVAVVSRVEEGLASRRALERDDQVPTDRVPPPLVARAVAGVARPALRDGREVAVVRVAEATPTDLLRELRQRLRRPLSRRARRRGRRGRGGPADRG